MVSGRKLPLIDDMKSIWYWESKNWRVKLLVDTKSKKACAVKQNPGRAKDTGKVNMQEEEMLPRVAYPTCHRHFLAFQDSLLQNVLGLCSIGKD